MVEAILEFFADSLLARSTKGFWVLVVVVFLISLPIVYTGWGVSSIKVTIPVATVFVICMYAPRRG